MHGSLENGTEPMTHIIAQNPEERKTFVRWFEGVFPEPRFLAMPAVGLDITDTAVRAVSLQKRGERLEVAWFAEEPLPDGTITGGYVNKKEGLVEALTRIRSKFSFEFVNGSLPEEKAFLFKTQIPTMEPWEIRTALEFKLEENVPVKTSEVIFDYTVIKNKEKTAHLDIAVTAIPTKVAETYLGVIRESGLSLVSFEIEAQAIARALVKRGDRRTFLIVNFEASRTGLYLVSQGIALFTSTVPIGSNAITAAIAKHFHVSIAEADRIKKEKGFIRSRKNMEIFFSLMNTISALRDEIDRLFGYLHTHPPGAETNGVASVILCGRDAGLAGFSEYLSSTLKIPVSVGNVWQNVCLFEEYIPPIPRQHSLDFAAAVGLALPREF